MRPFTIPLPSRLPTFIEVRLRELVWTYPKPEIDAFDDGLCVLCTSGDAEKILAFVDGYMNRAAGQSEAAVLGRAAFVKDRDNIKAVYDAIMAIETLARRQYEPSPN